MRFHRHSAEMVCVPENEIRMGHEICDTFKHAPWLEYERWKGNPMQVHAHSAPQSAPKTGSGQGRKHSLELLNQLHDDRTFIFLSALEFSISAHKGWKHWKEHKTTEEGKGRREDECGLRKERLTVPRYHQVRYPRSASPHHAVS